MYAKYDATILTKRVFGVEPDKIASTVLLAPARFIIKELEEQIQEPHHFGAWFTGISGFLEQNIPITILDNVRYAPGMVDCVYFLQFAGVRNILYTGSIGGLGKAMGIGDIILATEAERGDGASGYFAPIYEQALANKELTQCVQSYLLKAAKQFGRRLHIGKIFTTDSLAAENLDFLSALQLQNFLGIEMETSALFIVAQRMNMKAVAAHAVSDLPLQKKTLFDNYTSKEKERRASAHSAVVNAFTKVIKALTVETK